MARNEQTRDLPPPYSRRGRLKPIFVITINTTLCVLLLVICFLLVFLLLPKDSGIMRCVWPIVGRRCLWPVSMSQQLVVISFSGFRHDHIELVRARLGPHALANFARIERAGIRAKRVIPVYPSATLSSHHTLVTGLYPQHHGVTGDSLFDQKYPNITFNMNDQRSLNEAPWLDDWPEPIWSTLQRFGGLAGTLLWPLTDRPYHGDLPFQQISQFSQLNGHPANYSTQKRVEDLLWWLNNPRYKLDLILAYFGEPSLTAEEFGPSSSQLVDKIVEVDAILGRFLDRMDELHLTNQTDVIITSDHGMAPTGPGKTVVLTDYIDPTDYSYSHLGAMGAVYPNAGEEVRVYEKLRNASEHLHVYLLQDVPEELHFSMLNSRMPPVVLIPDAGWTIAQRAGEPVPLGSYGYPASNTDMHGILLASGPSFRVNSSIEQTYAVDVYPLLCALTLIEPIPNNGSLDRITPLLKPHVVDWLVRVRYWPRWFVQIRLHTQIFWLCIGAVGILLIFIGLLTVLALHRKHIHSSPPSVLSEDWTLPPYTEETEKRRCT